MLEPGPNVTAGRLLLSLLFMIGGLMHFLAPAPYLRIMPPILPWHIELVFLSGVAEFLCGALLLFRRWKRPAGFAAIFILIAVFPANIYMAWAHVPFPGLFGNSWFQWGRALLQVPLVIWAWQYTKPLLSELDENRGKRLRSGST